MPLLKEKLFTVEDIYALPEGQRAELIDGVLYNLAAPSRLHQKISMFLSHVISSHIDSKGMDCDVYAAPFAVFLSHDEYNYFEPDISVVCDKNKLSDRGCEGAPDWIIEIVSPSSQQMDYLLKLTKYRDSGVRLYWIVDPDLGTVMVHDFENDSMSRYKFVDAVPVRICEGFEIRLGELE